MDLQINLYAFLRDSLLLVLTWFLMATSFFVWGSFFSKILKINISNFKGVTAKIWLGFTFCIFFFSIYHLFAPINAIASILFYFSGIIVFLFKYSKKLPKFVKSIEKIKLLAIVLTLFAASIVSIQITTNFDTGLYHLNSIRWNNEYHIIKGLGNLHTRLGFNQTFFIYSSSLNFHPFLDDYGFHVSNSFLYALFFVSMILNGTFIDILLACLFFFIPMPYHWINSPSPDMASTLVQIIVFRYFVEAVHYNSQSNERIDNISVSAILSALLITLKLSNVFWAIGLGIITIIFIKKYSIAKTELKAITNAFIFIFLFFTLWIIRGYIQTGYPLFPSSIGKIDFKWTVPKHIANKMENNVYAGSRSCETTFDINSPIVKNFAWLPLWIKRHIYNEEDFWTDDMSENIYVIITLLTFPSTLNNYGMGSLVLLVSSMILLIFIFINKKRYGLKNHILLISLIVVEIVSILFWFFIAPCPRFSNGIFVILFTSSLLLLKTIYPQLSINNNIKRILYFYSLVLFIWNFNIAYSSKEFYLNGIQIIKPTKMREVVTNFGVKLLIPEARVVQCWDSPIPSTIEPRANLSFIGNRIEEGFYLK